MIQDLKAVLLVGGLGPCLAIGRTHHTQGPLPPLAKLSFLELVVEQLRSRGILPLVMYSGYLADQIETRKADFLILALTKT